MVRSFIAGLLLTSAASACAQTITLQPGETLLQVQAEGHAAVRPDAATLTIGVVSTGVTARAATDANAAAMAAVIAAVRKAGVAERYVRTRQISLQPRFRRESAGDYDGQATISGYVARNSVTVVVVTLAQAPDVVAAAFGAGANEVSGPDLRSDDPLAGVVEARAMALRNAKAQADGYAAGLGLVVTRVLRVSEGRESVSPNYDIVVTGSRISGMAAQPAPPAPIAGGDMERSISINIDYALALKE